MNNYLFFRTDRIGDFLVSAILLKSIKNNDKKSHITVVASRKNFFYIKTFNFIDEVFLYPEDLINKISLFYKLNKKKYSLICALDGKKRSIYFSILLKSEKKFLMTTKVFFKKIFNYFFEKIFVFKDSENKIEEIKEVLRNCRFTFNRDDVNFLDKYNLFSRKFSFEPNYSLIHFDEKWIHNDYIKKYKSIEPTLDEFVVFINDLALKSKLNVVISTGLVSNNILKEFNNSFNKIDEGVYEKIYKNKKIFLCTNLNFFDLKSLIKNCKYLITCHGASTHLASAFNKKIFDIIDYSEKEFYLKWNSHILNYNFFYRENFKTLTDKILKKI